MREERAFRYFPPLLLFVLGGYLFFNRAFAWIHVPGVPLFLGEAVMAVGIYEALGTRLVAPVIRRSSVFKALLALVVAGLLHLAWAFPEFGLDAVRDAALWYYGIYAVLVAVALAAEPGLFDRMLGAYLTVIPFFLAWTPLAVILERGIANPPTIPDSTTPIFSYKPSDFAVQSAIAVALVWLGVERGTVASRRQAQILTALGLVGILVAGSQNRGGMASALVILTIAFLYTPHKGRVFFGAMAVGMVALTLMLVFDVRVDLGRRELSVDQLLANAGSVIGLGEEEESELEGTVAWRLELWGEVVDDVVYGDYFLTGFGFGSNLAERYGFEGPDPDQPLRNAHNSHLTLFARMGMPGLVLWVLLWVLWFGVMVARIGSPRRLRQGSTLALAVWVTAAVTGMQVNAIFDPSLEGPQVGVWLWVLTGVGVALARGWAGPGPPEAHPATTTVTPRGPPPPWEGAEGRDYTNCPVVSWPAACQSVTECGRPFQWNGWSMPASS